MTLIFCFIVGVRFCLMETFAEHWQTFGCAYVVAASRQLFDIEAG